MLSSRPAHLDTDVHVHKASRTPGMALRGRNALQENALHQGPMTGNVKGKKVDTFQPRTLQPQRLFKDQAYSKPTIITSHAPARPLLDKTPFANRAGAPFVTPLPRGSKFAKLPILESRIAVQTPLLRPSSTRKHIRVPRSASKSFETPQSQGNHWDVSDISIEGPEVAVVNESIEEEDYDEIEYMPPSAIEPPYQPMFDMPDYKNIGRILSTAMLPCYFEDSPIYDSEQVDVLLETESYKLLLPELDDDDPLRPTAPPSELAPLESKSALRVTRTGVAGKSATMPSTTSTTVHHISRALPVTRPVSRPPATMRSTATAGLGVKKLPLSRKNASIPISRATSTAVTTSTVARNSTVSGQRYVGTSAAVRNGSATTTTSVRSTMLGGSSTDKPKANASTLSSRRLVTSSTCKPGVTSSARTSSRSTPVAGIRGVGKAKRLVDDEILLLKFDAMDGGGVEDFKFII